jgi:hypothetical protein
VIDTILGSVLVSETNVVAARTQFGPRHNVRVRPLAPRETVLDLEEQMICPEIAPEFKTIVNILARSVNDKNFRLAEGQNEEG